MQGAAHCAEFATEGAEIDLDKANECRRCYAKIGDWGTEAGFAQGQECLNTYEPSFTELCGEKMTAFQVEFFNLGIDIDLQYTIFGEGASFLEKMPTLVIGWHFIGTLLLGVWVRERGRAARGGRVLGGGAPEEDRGEVCRGESLHRTCLSGRPCLGVGMTLSISNSCDLT